jgi:hypothetical protein
MADKSRAVGGNIVLVRSRELHLVQDATGRAVRFYTPLAHLCHAYTPLVVQ